MYYVWCRSLICCFDVTTFYELLTLLSQENVIAKLHIQSYVKSYSIGLCGSSFVFVFKDSCNSAAVCIDHDYGQPDSEKDCDAKGLLEKGLNSLNFPVIQLPSKSNDVKKYNIVSNDDVQFVHVFSEQNSTYISCMSGVCQHGFGKKRKLESLREHQNLCIHLEVFREFMVNSRYSNFFLVFVLSQLNIKSSLAPLTCIPLSSQRLHFLLSNFYL